MLGLFKCQHQEDDIFVPLVRHYTRQEVLYRDICRSMEGRDLHSI